MRRGKRFGELHDARNEGSLTVEPCEKWQHFECAFYRQLFPNASVGFIVKLSPSIKSPSKPDDGVAFYGMLSPRAIVIWGVGDALVGLLLI